MSTKDVDKEEDGVGGVETSGVWGEVGAESGLGRWMVKCKKKENSDQSGLKCSEFGSFKAKGTPVTRKVTESISVPVTQLGYRTVRSPALLDLGLPERLEGREFFGLDPRSWLAPI